MSNKYDSEFWTKENYFALADLKGPFYMDRRILKEGLSWGKGPTKGAEKALTFLKENGINEVLDMGCGYGRDAYYFATNGINVTGIEYSKLAVDFANIEFKNKLDQFGANDWGEMKVFNEDFRKWNPDKKYPAVFTFKTLHQFRYNPDSDYQHTMKDPLSVTGIIKKIKECLQPNGYLILSTFNTKDHNFGKGQFIEGYTWDTRGFRPGTFYNEDNLRKILSDFKIELIEELPPIYEDHDPDGKHTHYMWFVVAKMLQ